MTMQWRAVGCCHDLNWTLCMEMTAGILQVFVQWFSFTLMCVFHPVLRENKWIWPRDRFVLYIWYYPARLRTLDSELDSGRVRMSEWRFSVFCAWITFGHLCVFLCPPLMTSSIACSVRSRRCTWWRPLHPHLSQRQTYLNTFGCGLPCSVSRRLSSPWSNTHLNWYIRIDWSWSAYWVSRWCA